MNFSRMHTSQALFVLACTLAAPAFAAPGSTSAYVTDLQTSHVEDATSRGIGDVNMITCIMHAMRPDALVNEPSYIALVDKNKCESEKGGSSSSANANDGAQAAAEYITATVTSSRESNTAPMITKAWLDLDEGDAHVQISLHVSATEAPSETNPYGAFRLDYCGQLDGTGDCLMHGFLEAANGGINYFDFSGGDEQTTAMNLTVSGSTGTGKLHIDGNNNNGGSADFAFAYDATLFHRDIGGQDGDQCFSRDASDPATGFSVWRYGLYDASTGARITRNSGFPIEFTPNGTTYHGYLGYYGLSLPPDAQNLLEDGDTVNKVDYSNGGGDPVVTAYTVTKNEGKLIKYTKRQMTLAQLDQVRFNLFAGMEGANLFAGASANTQYEMYWDETQQSFVITAQIQCGMSGCQTQPVAQQPTVAASFWSERGGLQGWSQSLGGELFIDLHDLVGAVDSSQTQVVYRSQDIVYPGDSSLPDTLYCLQNCPTAATLQAYFTSSDPNAPTSPYTSSTYNNWNPTAIGAQIQYSVDTDTAMLNDGAASAVTYTDAERYSERPQYANGVMTGRLFATLSVATCVDFQNNPAYCDYKVNDAEVYYQWQTGPNNWNQFAAVKDGSGNLVQFEAPLQLSYHVPDTAAYGQYRNTNTVLQYGGFGDLWGVPGTCVSANTNETVECNTPESRYVPAFIIPYGAQNGTVTSTGDDQTSYLVKWLDREIRFARKTGSDCADLDLPANANLPDESDLKNPTDSASDIYIGVRPEVTDAARVIHGDVKY
jgi:hypothetical protein